MFGLRLVETDKGLGFEIKLPDTGLGEAIARMAKASQLRGMSIGFAGPKRKAQVRDVSENNSLPLTTNHDEVPDGSSMVVGRDQQTNQPFQVVTDVDLTEVSVITPGVSPSYSGTTAQLVRAKSDERDKLNLWVKYYEHNVSGSLRL